jgi:Bacteriocin-protection, YdeI or OmpD-Associated/Domain of unknown function (DUF1905)
MSKQQFETTVEGGERGRVFIVMPFDPKSVWGKQARYYVKGTLNSFAFQGSLGVRGAVYFMPLNKELQKGAQLTVGARVKVVMEADEAQKEEVPSDLQAALSTAPSARQFFKGLSAFYHNLYIEWLAEAKTAKTRTARLSETVELLRAGKKQRV